VRSFREEEDNDEKGERDDDDDARSVSKRRRRRRCFSVGISFLGRRSKEMQSKLLRGRFCGNT
jgi:hypothetical protein